MYAQNVPLSFLLKFARWSKGVKPIFEKRLKGVTFHVGNKLFKAILKSVFFLQKKSNFTYQVFGKKEAVESHQTKLKQFVLKDFADWSTDISNEVVLFILQIATPPRLQILRPSRVLHLK